MEKCQECGRLLCADEVAVTRKLVNRGAKSFYCVDCLASYFAVSPDDIRERIAYFKKTGCTLFETETGACAAPDPAARDFIPCNPAGEKHI